MTQTRLPYGYGLAALPSIGIEELRVPSTRGGRGPTGATLNNLAPNNFDVTTPTLASLGTSWSPSLGHDVLDGPAFGHSEDQDMLRNFSGRPIQTAFLQGSSVIGDAIRSAPSLVEKVSDDEIEPIRPGRTVQRKPLDAKPSEKRLWRPFQFELPHYEAPEGVPERINRLLNKPGLDQQMVQVIGAGKAMMNGADWYDTDFLRDRLVKRYGENEGTSIFQQFMDFIAATSPGSDVGTNIRNASFYFNKVRRGEPLPNSSTNNPYPYGHWLGDQHIALLGMLLMSGALDPILYPKITSFSQSLRRNELTPVIDIHALRLPAMLARAADFLKKEYREKVENRTLSMDEAVAHPSYWRGPYPNEIGPLRQLYKDLAPEVELTPVETQGGAWVGGGHITGVRSNGLWTFKQHFEDRIRRTAKKWGLTEEQVWDLFLDNKLDLVLHDGAQNPVA